MKIRNVLMMVALLGVGSVEAVPVAYELRGDIFYGAIDDDDDDGFLDPISDPNPFGQKFTGYIKFDDEGYADNVSNYGSYGEITTIGSWYDRVSMELEFDNGAKISGSQGRISQERDNSPPEGYWANRWVQTRWGGYYTREWRVTDPGQNSSWNVVYDGDNLTKVTGARVGIENMQFSINLLDFDYLGDGQSLFESPYYITDLPEVDELYSTLFEANGQDYFGNSVNFSGELTHISRLSYIPEDPIQEDPVDSTTPDNTVPVPATMALMLLGMVGSLSVRKFRTM
jgi:hypothetical protein